MWRGPTCSTSLVVAVDDVHKIDEPSAALLVALVTEAASKPIFCVLSAESGAPGNAQPLAVLAAHCQPLELVPLDREQTLALL